MTMPVAGLHHVTALASDARQIDRFFTQMLGVRRVKKTVNFDAPEIYHLYYADRIGTPGTVMTYFPFPGAAAGRPGTGEVAATALAIPEGAAGFWAARLEGAVADLATGDDPFGDRRVTFSVPDGGRFALVEAPRDTRAPWTATVGADHAVRGLHAVRIAVEDAGPLEDLLALFGYGHAATEGGIRRFSVPGGAARILDLEVCPGGPRARQGAGSVHHVAFAVPDAAAQAAIRSVLVDAGYDVTPVIDRDYFRAIYFRAPGGVLFEIATAEPGFDRDESVAELGQGLKLPARHEHLRDSLRYRLEDLDDAPRAG